MKAMQRPYHNDAEGTMRNEKRKVYIAGIILLAFALISYGINHVRISFYQEPLFCIKVITHHGAKVTYWGLGYKVIRFISDSPDEPLEYDRDVRMGCWFMNDQRITEEQ